MEWSAKQDVIVTPRYGIWNREVERTRPSERVRMTFTKNEEAKMICDDDDWLKRNAYA